MKKLHLGAALFSILLVGVIVIAAGTGALFGTTDTDGPTTSDESQSDGADSMTVENVSVHNRTAEGVLYLDIAVAGKLDIEQLGRSIERLYDDPSVNVSTIELVTVQQNVATDGNTFHHSSDGDSSNGDTQGPDTSVKRSVVTVAIVTDDRSSSAHVVNRVEHYLNNENLNEQSDQQTEQTDDSATEYTVVSPGKVCKVTTAYYQVDFVVGEPIEQLQGPEGTYLPHELIRFAHGSTEEPIVRRSDGEFITHEVLAERIESQDIEVENGMATVTFSISEGAAPVTLSLVSYTKPGPGWSRAMEHLQEFVDADTKMFEAGGPYTLRVDLPDAETGPCKTVEKGSTPTPTQTTMPTTTEPAPTCPTPATAETSGIDLKLWSPDGQTYTDNKIRITITNFAPGETRTKTIRIVNAGTATANGLSVSIENVTSTEGINTEAETDTKTSNGGELDDQLQIRAIYRDGQQYVVIGDTVSANGFVDFTAAKTGQHRMSGFDLPESTPLNLHDYDTLTVQFRFPNLPTNNRAQGDTVTFDLVITLFQSGEFKC